MDDAGERSVKELLADYLARWSLARDGDPVTTPGSHIVFVTSPFGPAVLKLFRPPYEEARSSSVLAHLGDIAPHIYRSTDRALLMERLQPGTPLAALSRGGRDDEATEIICDIAERLRALPLPRDSFPTIEQWGEGFRRHRARSGHRLVSPALIDEAEQTYFDLCRTQGERVLLHGDLHHYNILRDAVRGWLVIDPKGVIGEPPFELGAALRNPFDCRELTADPAQLMRRVGLMSRRLGYAPERVLRWHFAQGLLSVVWLAEDGFADSEIASGLKLAELSRQLLA